MLLEGREYVYLDDLPVPCGYGKNGGKVCRETGLSDGLLPKQAVLICVHALNKLHSHEIHVVLNADEDVTLVDVDVVVEVDTHIQGRMAVSQAKAYNFDLQHFEKVLSMPDTDKPEPAKVEEVLEASAPKRRKGVVIQDPEETAIASVIMHIEVKPKDKGKGILNEEPKPLKGQAQIDIDEAFARQLEAELNVNINWNDVIEQVKRSEKQDNTVMSEIRPIFEKHYNFIQAFLEKGEKEIKEEGSKRKATPLASKVPVVDYQIHHEHNKPCYKIIRADRTHQLFLSFITLLKNFDREDLKALWKLVKEIFESTEPKNFSDDFLLNTLKIMFEKPNVEASVWRDQKGSYGLAKIKS
uniref:Uncharacterized protein n=1 Tax=Tanacetum cinerariifolium TaxID=118510 RepID=A0A6L2KKV7_TANCI|nr:hypothetical protein [Tanacetum cinerariifolium]